METINKKSSINIIKNILLFLKPFKGKIAVIFISIIIISGLEAYLPVMQKIAIDDFILRGTTQGINLFLIKYIAITMSLLILIYIFISFGGKVEMALVYSLREKAFEKLQYQSFSYFDINADGWIMARMTSDIRKIGEIVAWGFVDMIWSIGFLSGILVMMFRLNYKLALVLTLLLPILIIISIYFQRKILRSQRDVRKINSLITGAYNEGILGAKTSKILVNEEKNIDEFENLSSRMNRTSVGAAIITALYLPMIIGLNSVGLVAVLGIGKNFILNGVISVGTLVLFINYTTMFFDPIKQFSRVFTEMQSAHASFERVLELIHSDLEIEDSKEIIEKYGDLCEKKIHNWEKIEGNVEFKDVDFKYNNGEPILQDFNLKISSGETIALVGETGSGKSTIVNLACRFYEPTKGSVLIDGTDYKERSQSWLHHNLGYVLQTPHLFSGTIKDNISYGKREATFEEIVGAAKLVKAHDFIHKFKHGYDTEVGEGGNNLSTGQKQLISFARAILKNPSIFILDEATSSIDAESEKMIQDATDILLHGRTSFIIAHRLSTIINADRILVIKDGKIIEEGNHHFLMDKKGSYFTLYTHQFTRDKESKLMSQN
ncbi:ABC transporter ATP-binding protein [Psychrilyobacter atlanticus]|uniref:ABC transporter ATP-binding protein n=1 Tax=Psychrilyobacter atlanticus TaxID=271091 RepID=UPI00042A2024|nr:ABC transporter ATP-binding protein [Psychrilyobacter atlanticus]